MAQPPPRREGHPYYMYDSIVQQPEAIERVIKEEAPHIQTLSVALSNASSIHIVGIGTSWHGALVGEYFLRSIANRHDARAWNSFEFCSLPPALSSTSVVIVLSHRGTKQFSRKALDIAKEAGAFTALLTGLKAEVSVTSPPATPALTGIVIHTSVQEKSSAFTISHTCAMTALMLTAIELGKLQGVPQAVNLQAQITKLPDLVRAVLAVESQIEELANKTKDKPMFYFVSYGNNVATTYETALKIKEACYVFCEGFQLEQYVHGPFCATDDRTVVVFLDHISSPDHVGPARIQEIIRAALEVGATVVGVSAEAKDVKSDKYSQILLPAIDENFAPIVYLVATQLFTYKLALARGENPDIFRKQEKAFAEATARYKL